MRIVVRLAAVTLVAALHTVSAAGQEPASTASRFGVTAYFRGDSLSRAAARHVDAHLAGRRRAFAVLRRETIERNVQDLDLHDPVAPAALRDLRALGQLMRVHAFFDVVAERTAAGYALRAIAVPTATGADSVTVALAPRAIGSVMRLAPTLHHQVCAPERPGSGGGGSGA